MEELQNQDAAAVAGGEVVFQQIYTVQKGDTLAGIAAMYNLNVHQIYKENEGTLGRPFPGHLEYGQRLLIRRYGNFAPGESHTERMY